jgi:hypothetical protein
MIYLIKSVDLIPFDGNFSDCSKLDFDTVKYLEGIKILIET